LEVEAVLAKHKIGKSALAMLAGEKPETVSLLLRDPTLVAAHRRERIMSALGDLVYLLERLEQNVAVPIPLDYRRTKEIKVLIEWVKSVPEQQEIQNWSR
jgi:DNA-binding LacI/PurR family transcriptional regulator